MSDFIRVPLAAAVAALTLTGCNMSTNCKESEAGKAATAATQAAATGAGKTATAATETRVRKTVETRAVRHPGRRERVEGGYRYASTGGGYVAGGRRYAGGVSVEVSETETSSSRYRYAETEERYGSRGGYAYGSSSASGGGYASTGGGYPAPPPPMAGRPVQHPGYNLAGTDRNGYLTWPGKVED